MPGKYSDDQRLIFLQRFFLLSQVELLSCVRAGAPTHPVIKIVLSIAILDTET